MEGGGDFYGILGLNAKGVMNVGGSRDQYNGREHFESLDSLECYFTYFRTRFEENLQPHKNHF